MARRIGLLTLPLHFNYGGILQAVALYETIRSETEREVVFVERASRPDWPLHWFIVNTLSPVPGLGFIEKILQSLNKKHILGKGTPLAKVLRKVSQKVTGAVHLKNTRHHRRFVERQIPLRSGPVLNNSEMVKCLTDFEIDTMVVGSDQVWRLDYAPDEQAKHDFFLAFTTDPRTRKISYAASFGEDKWAYPLYTERVKEHLADFDAISVREQSGVEICQQVFGITDARHVLDPTLLLDETFYEGIAARSRKRSSKTMLTYILDEGADRKKVCEEIRNTLGSDYTVESLTLNRGLGTIDVPGWLRAFLDADFVVTDSFHGMVFSIIFRKNFVAIANRERGADRFLSLLKLLKLDERLVFEPQAEKLHRLAEEKIDFNEIDRKLAQLRSESLDFLRKALQ